MIPSVAGHLPENVPCNVKYMDLWVYSGRLITILPCFFKLPVFSRDTLTRPIVCLLDLTGTVTPGSNLWQDTSL